MSDFAYAFNAVFPLFVYMALGVIIKKLNWASDRTFNQMNSITFKTFLPIMIFVNIYHSGLEEFPGLMTVLYPILAISFTFVIAWLFVGRTNLEFREKGVVTQAIFRSNYVLFGVPLVLALIDGKTTGVTEVLLATIIPLFNIYAVIILSWYGGHKVNGKEVVRKIITNPLILASVLGIFAKWIRLNLPGPLEASLSALGKIATPMALIILGAQFRFADSRKYVRKLVAICSLRLLIVPAALLSGAALLGMRGEVMVSYLPLFGGPVAVSSYTMAYQMGADDQLAGQILVYTSALCLPALFMFIVLLRKLSLI